MYNVANYGFRDVPREAKLNRHVDWAVWNRKSEEEMEKLRKMAADRRGVGGAGRYREGMMRLEGADVSWPKGFFPEM